MKKIRKYIIAIVSSTFLLTGIAIAIGYYYVFAPQFHSPKQHTFYIDRDDNCDSIYSKLREADPSVKLWGFKCLANLKDYNQHIKTGCYQIEREENIFNLFKKVYRGYQTPVKLIIRSVRTPERLIPVLDQQLMADSLEIAAILTDSLFFHCIPNTYEVYWNLSAADLKKRILKEHRSFWNEERMRKAKELDMTPWEITTLASIVEEETNNKKEKPIVAGLYMNRLKRGILLQADPTIKYALRNFELRRITNKDLEVESPYNTYKNLGLPPTPIRMATPEGIDAVLNYAHHNYIYMCAKEDFSGTHNFATSLAEHMRNARKYWHALNQLKIYK